MKSRALEIRPDAYYTRDYLMDCGLTPKILHQMACDKEQPAEFFCSNVAGRRSGTLCKGEHVLRLIPMYMAKVVPGKTCTRLETVGPRKSPRAKQTV
jgi:hypothetical protein